MVLLSMKTLERAIRSKLSATKRMLKSAHAQNLKWGLGVLLLIFFALCERLELTAAQLTANTSNTGTDLQALEDFKTSLSSTSLSPIFAAWTGSTFCNWPGVTCNNGGRVQELNLSSQVFSGKIPPSLQNLTSLERLELSRNDLSGDIPAFIGSFANLIRLDLSGNSLSGSIPPTVGNLSRLEHLDLSQNKLSGLIPASICSLSSATLRFLSLASNNLSGSIPDTLDLCRNLTGLYLGGNTLGGTIPDIFGPLVNLTTLDLSFNNLTGAIPRFSNGLITLTLKNNRLSGSLINQSVNLPNSLTLLSLSGNSFGDDIPEEISKLSGLIKLELNDNSFSGSIPDTSQWSTFLDTLDLGGNHLSGVIPSSIDHLKSLTILKLDRNALSGSIPASIGNLNRLSVINLAENQLTGEIPPEIVNILGLTLLNVSSNNLSGSVPKPSQSRPDLVVITDPGLSNAYAPSPNADPLSSFTSHADLVTNQRSWILKIVLIVDGFLVLLNAFGVYGYLRSATPKEEKVVPLPEPSIEDSVTVDELRKMTNHFHEDCVIGRGARSIVYKGIAGGGQVAVKVLKMENAEKDRETLIRELQTLGRVRHRNLLRILAVCSDVESRALVLEYMPFSSLDRFLHNMVGTACLSWDTRFNILRGVAQGLVYLHGEHQQPIIHCDLKPSNILLDSDFEPKVADFGIAKYVNPGSGDASMSGLSGTIGYIPPEYAWATSVSTKGDVFSFGIVLLEVLTARKPYEGWDVEVGQPGSLVEFAASAYPDNVMSILDPNLVILELDRDLHQQEVKSVMRIGLMCTQVDPRDRPDMTDVLRKLTDIKVSRYSSTGRRKYRKVDELAQLPTLWEVQDDPERRILEEPEETNLENWIAKRMPYLA